MKIISDKIFFFFYLLRQDLNTFTFYMNAQWNPS